MRQTGKASWSVISAAAVAFALGLAPACKPSAEPPAAPAGQPAAQATPEAAPKAVETAPGGALSPAAIAEGEAIFAQRCVTCHGATGKGDGAASAGLTPKPRDFTSAEWQDSVTDEHIEKIVKFGGAAVGRSPMMPPNPDLTAKEEVVKAIRAHVRGLKGK